MCPGVVVRTIAASLGHVMCPGVVVSKSRSCDVSRGCCACLLLAIVDSFIVDVVGIWMFCGLYYTLCIAMVFGLRVRAAGLWLFSEWLGFLTNSYTQREVAILRRSPATMLPCCCCIVYFKPQQNTAWSTADFVKKTMKHMMQYGICEILVTANVMPCFNRHVARQSH